MGSAQQTRPTGVTILAVLEILVALSLLAGGIGFIVVAGLLGIVGAEFIPSTLLGEFLGPFLGVMGIGLAVIGLIGFLLAWGLWTGKSWAWTVTIIFAILGVISGLLGLPSGIVTVILNGLIFYYITRPAVKAFFGKKPVSVTI